MSVGRLDGLGFCGGVAGLVLQVAWFHSLRFVLGTSTVAMAVGTAVFMGGLAVGSLALGPRAEQSPQPLQVYAFLEGAIALTGALSPFLLEWAKAQNPGALPLFLAMLAVGLPAVLMGGTLPALSRAALSASSTHRGHFGWVYGLNTLGAAVGALLGGFFLLPVFGARWTIWTACLGDVLVAGLAWYWNRSRLSLSAREFVPSEKGYSDNGRPFCESLDGRKSPAGLSEDPGGDMANSEWPVPGNLLLVAFLTGGGFFLMEVVWYRLLGPLLGGTVQAFGILLAAILAGLAAGALVLPFLTARVGGSKTWLGAASLASALAVSAPFALGDRVPLWVAQALEVGTGGGWNPPGSVTALVSVVLPGALLCGLLLPLLVTLVGRGRPGLATQAGWLLGANTLGGLLGGVVGGVWLLPWLTVKGCWLLVTGTYVGAGLLIIRASAGARSRNMGWALVAGVVCFLPFLSSGPTAFWRHSHPPQAARMIRGKSPTQIRDVMEASRRRIVWEREGRETALAIANAAGLTLLTNGNGEGNVTQDQAMLISLGLVGAVRHPVPRNALVIGLGTGCTAGWLAEVPGMERVEVFELEPELTEMSRRCAALNHDVLHHAKVQLRFGDGRHLLKTATGTYDLIVSAPSNLFRVGMAGLFSQDFFRLAAGRLRPGGLFGLWVQVYQIDREAWRIILGTLQSVFPHVEGWLVDPRHVLLLASREANPVNLEVLAGRMQQPFWQTAFEQAWQTGSVEGVLARSLGCLSLGIELPPVLNTDDHLVLEFRMGALLGTSRASFLEELLSSLPKPSLLFPRAPGIDVRKQALERLLILPLAGQEPLNTWPSLEPADEGWRAALRASLAGRWSEAVNTWPPLGLSPFADLLAAEAFAHLGDPWALELASQARALRPAEADLVEARFLAQTGAVDRAAELLGEGFRRLGKPPQACSALVQRGVQLAHRLAAGNPQRASLLFDSLRSPFFLDAWQEHRLLARIDLGLTGNLPGVSEAFHAFEPHVPWNQEFLAWRAKAYEAIRDPLAAAAAEDLRQFLAAAPR